MIHILHRFSFCLYCSLLSRFILLEFMSESDDILVLILWTLMSWKTLTVCLLEQWASSMQSFTRVIIGADALESEFLRIKQLQMMNLQLILTTMKNSCSLIPSGTKNLSKFIYTLVNLFLNTLQNLLNFYFWFHTVIYIGRVYLVQSEIPALVVSIA